MRVAEICRRADPKEKRETRGQRGGEALTPALSKAGRDIPELVYALSIL